MAERPERRKDDRRTKTGDFVDAKSVIQAVVIGGIVAAIIHLFSLPRIEERLENVAKAVAELKEENKKIREDFYTPRFSHSNDKLANFEPVKEQGNGK